MRGFLAPTDRNWFDFLAGRGVQDEVNFWSPSGTNFRALRAGEPFFFKMKAPDNAIGGFGIFVRAEPLPIWLAWESFGEANGADGEAGLLARINVNRAGATATVSTPIGCRILADPVFFPRDAWVRTPQDWSTSIVSGKGHPLDHGEGARIWSACLEAASALSAAPLWVEAAEQEARFGRPQLVRPRLGQGGFRLAVFDAYSRACCVTGEHSLPVLEAAHIRPYAQGGRHEVRNGLPLRRDLHRLFDLGYVTVRPDFSFVVGERLRLEYDNGRSYYALNGKRLHVPEPAGLRPAEEFLSYHNEKVFRAS